MARRTKAPEPHTLANLIRQMDEGESLLIGALEEICEWLDADEEGDEGIDAPTQFQLREGQRDHIAMWGDLVLASLGERETRLKDAALAAAS